MTDEGPAALQPSPTLVLLHGFGGSPHDWAATVAEELSAVCPTLPGHGPQATPPRDFDDATHQLIDELPPPPWHLVGYSLGGRLALSLATMAQSPPASLTLIGAHPGGLTTPEGRIRRNADDALALELEEDAAAFFERWDALPIFRNPDSQDDRASDTERRTRRHGHAPAALAGTLRNLSLGRMPDFRAVLRDPPCPIHLIAGEHDEKYRGLFRPWAHAHPAISFTVIPKAGHRVPVDAPEALGRTLTAWLSEHGTGLKTPGRQHR